MNKDSFIKLINEDASVGYLATIDGAKPKVRPIAAKYTEGKLMFSTFRGSDKMKQLGSNNFAEISWTFPDWTHIRLEATSHIHEDKELKKKYLDDFPMLKKYFKGENDPDFMLVELKPSKIRFMDLNKMNYEDISW